MATNIGTLMATVGVDTRPLKKGLKDAERQTKASTGKMLSHWKAMATGIIATYAVFKMTKLVKEAALAHARFETLGIVMKVVGKNANYSAEEMNRYDLALRKTGISMIESRNSLARMAMAQLDLNKATQLGRIAQDAAVIGNINSSEAFQRMIYGIQTGNLIVLRRIGINVSFEQSYKDIAAATDRTVESFSEAEKAIIRQNAVIKYGARIAGTYEAAMTTAGKKLTSFVRYVEDFKVKMGMAFGPATVMLVDAATTAMKEFQIEISRPEAQEALRNLSSQLAITIVQLGKDLPNAVEMITNKINTLVQLYNSLPEGVIGATGTGLIGRMMFGSWTAASFLGLLYLITEQIGKLGADKLSKLFSGMSLEEAKKWREELDLAAFQEGTLKIKFDEQGINQFVKMQEMLAKGTTIRLDFALEDPDKYYGEVKFPEKLKRTEEYYDQLELLAQEKMAFETEFEDEETRMFEENLAYRLELKQQYYQNLETAAREARDFDEEMENEKIRMARETAAYQKELNAQRLLDIQSSVSMMTQGFQQISEMGGKHSKEAFAMYKAFKTVETIISTHSAAIKAYESLVGIPYVGPALAAAAAAAAVAFGMAQVAMIQSAQPPSYDQGGISSAGGLYRTGPIKEAHIPLERGGKIPVRFESGKESPQDQNQMPLDINIVNVNDPNQLDLYLSSARGQDAIINVLGARSQTVRRILR